MKFAFALYNYFPFGGLQKNCLNIARACKDRGHEIEFFTREWTGEQPDWARVNIVKAKGLTNHGRGKQFYHQLGMMLADKKFDGVIGFNRMPGLDVYYAADVCFKEKSLQRYGFWYQLTPRYRHYVEFENSIFGEESQTDILLVAEAQKQHFIKHYGTRESRFHLLPPGISRACMATSDAGEKRTIKRKELRLSPAEHAVFLIGSGFRTKGLDRAIALLAALPGELAGSVKLFVVGEDDFSEYSRLAENLGVATRVEHLGGRKDVPDLLQAADALLHPAYSENTGNVILEAIVAGLPVMATDVCGYAHYITDAGAGLVNQSPWDEKTAVNQFMELLVSDKRMHWRENGIRFGKENDFYHRAEFAAQIIEQSCDQ